MGQGVRGVGSEAMMVLGDEGRGCMLPSILEFTNSQMF